MRATPGLPVELGSGYTSGAGGRVAGSSGGGGRGNAALEGFGAAGVRALQRLVRGYCPPGAAEDCATYAVGTELPPSLVVGLQLFLQAVWLLWREEDTAVSAAAAAASAAVVAAAVHGGGAVAAVGEAPAFAFGMFDAMTVSALQLLLNREARLSLRLRPDRRAALTRLQGRLCTLSLGFLGEEELMPTALSKERVFAGTQTFV